MKAEANGLVPGHAYTVTDVTKVSSFYFSIRLPLTVDNT